MYKNIVMLLYFIDTVMLTYKMGKEQSNRIFSQYLQKLFLGKVYKQK